MRINCIFRWYNLWSGVYLDWQKSRIYVFPVPCFGVKICLRDSDCGLDTVGELSRALDEANTTAAIQRAVITSQREETDTAKRAARYKQEEAEGLLRDLTALRATVHEKEALEKP